MSTATATGLEAFYARLAAVGVLPVVVLERPEDAAPLARALIAGGLPAAEVTFRTSAAEEAIRIMSDEGGLLLGAGTIVRPDQAEAAVDAGAQFIVSPGWSDQVFAACRASGVPLVPGTATASDIQRAVEHQVEVVKFFPAETAGGLAAIKALSAPFGNVRFVPTGGITMQSAPGYLADEAVLAVGGSWMVPGALIRSGNWAEITRHSAAAVAMVAKGRTAG